ncbi:hypothetical protein DM860_008327 [Cuscuta australis]|uniref:Uncharacterized protein n=1 Tax=Cuscuta australis TaxID=267555 RepID=A0A328D304_9ASTE|nr:hypothetical protein DM860_008327 [Cuscuta australis]
MVNLSQSLGSTKSPPSPAGKGTKLKENLTSPRPSNVARDSSAPRKNSANAELSSSSRMPLLPPIRFSPLSPVISLLLFLLLVETNVVILRMAKEYMGTSYWNAQALVSPYMGEKRFHQGLGQVWASHAQLKVAQEWNKAPLQSQEEIDCL